MSEKQIYNFGFFVFRLTLIAAGFFFWFILLSCFGYQLAGVVVGAVTASLAFIISIPNSKFQCDNVNTQHAGTHADDHQKKKRFTRSNEHPYNGRQFNQGHPRKQERNRNGLPTSEKKNCSNTQFLGKNIWDNGTNAK